MPPTRLSALRPSPIVPVILVAFFVMLLLISRQPDMFYRPQFYAEDGHTWYKQAHDMGGARILFLPLGGYLDLLSRLVAMVAQLLPLPAVPLFFSLTALLVRAAPVFFALSSRVQRVFPSMASRLCLAFFLVALPGSGEVHSHLTNAHTPLALFAALVLILAEPAETKGWLYFDAIVAVLAGLSGPFGLSITPLAIARRYWAKKQTEPAKAEEATNPGPYRPRLIEQLLLSASVMQLVVLLVIAPHLDWQNRRPPIQNYGASLGTAAHLLGGKVMATFLLGDNRYNASLHHLTTYPYTVPWNTAIAAAVSLVGLALIVRACGKAPRELTLFMIFAGLTLAAALAFPLTDNTKPAWPAMAFDLGSGNRYFFFSVAAFALCLVRLAFYEKVALIRGFAVFLLLVAVFGARWDWKLPAWPDCHFPQSAAAYEQAAPGTRCHIPSAPGPNWDFELTK